MKAKLKDFTMDWTTLIVVALIIWLLDTSIQHAYFGFAIYSEDAQNHEVKKIWLNVVRALQKQQELKTTLFRFVGVCKLGGEILSCLVCFAGRLCSGQVSRGNW